MNVKLLIFLVALFLGGLIQADDNPAQILDRFNHIRSQQEGVLYIKAVEYLTMNPKSLDLVPPMAMETLVFKVRGIYLRPYIPPTEWDRLDGKEIILLAQMVRSLQSRVDPSIDTTRLIPEYYSSYEETIPLEERDEGKKRDFYAARAQAIKQDSLEEEQVGVKRALDAVINRSRDYLNSVYSDHTTQVQDEEAVLAKAGFGKETLDALFHPSPGQ